MNPLRGCRRNGGLMLVFIIVCAVAIGAVAMLIASRVV